MTGRDVLNQIVNSFPPLVMALILVAVLVAVVIFIAGFSKHGINFLKYGFKQTALDNSLRGWTTNCAVCSPTAARRA
jgi:hypothetical protein